MVKYLLIFLLVLSLIFINAQEIIIEKESVVSCQNKSVSEVFRISLSFFEIYIGELKCSSLNLLNYFFEIEQINKTYKIIGLKIWWILTLFFLIVIIKLMKSNRKTDNILEKVWKNR